MVFFSQEEISIDFTKINFNFGFLLFSKCFISQNFVFKKFVLVKKIKKTLFLIKSFTHED